MTDASLTNGRKFVDYGDESTPFLWSSGAQLIDYINAKGEKLQASLYLPANYEKGKQYPTIVYIYERLTQGHNTYGRPTRTASAARRTRATATRCCSRTSSTT